MSAPDLARARSLLIHHILGQLDAADRGEVDAALQHSPALRAERASLENTVMALRSAPALQPSARFRAALDRRLDREEASASRALERDQRSPSGVSLEGPGASRARGLSGHQHRSGIRGNWSFRWHLLGHRLRTSPRLRFQLAASLLPLFLGLGWLLLSEDESLPLPTPQSASWTPEPEVDDVAGGSVSELIVRHTVPETESLEQRAPVFEPELSEPSLDEPLLELPEPPSGRLVRDEGLEPIPGLRRPPEPPPLDRPPEQGSSVGPEWERPVRKALRWMLAQQGPQGTWSPSDGDADLEVAVTAVSLLAFVSDGHLGLRPAAEDPLGVDAAVRRARDALLARRRSGVFGPTPDFASETFNHVTATLALCEHYTLALAAGADAGPLEEERRAVAEGLDVLETRLRHLFRPRDGDRDPAERRGEGVNAAWAAMALSSARSSGLDWGLSGVEGREVDAMYARLGNRPRSLDSGSAGNLLYHSMNRVLPADEEMDEWARVVTRLVERPRETEPGLRFLVASAFAPWQDQPSDQALRRWKEFQARLERSLIDQQSRASGFFEVGVRGSFDGGPVYDTALCVLTLQIEHRIERLRAASRSR